MHDESALYLSVRDLLRHLDDPHHLQTHPLVVRSFAATRRPVPREPTDLMFAIRWSIEKSCGALPVVLRAIVVRCDLGGELHRTVALSLGLSERYFYKQRRRALVRLGHLMLDGGSEPSSGALFAADPLEINLCRVTALQNLGDFDGGITILKTLTRACDDAATLTYLQYELAALYVDAERCQKADEAVRRGSETLKLVPSDGETRTLLACELESIRTLLSVKREPVDQARSRAQGALRHLRGLQNDYDSPRLGRALSAILLALVTLHEVRGNFGDALAAALEMRHLVERYCIQRPALKVRAFIRVPVIQYYMTGSTAIALSELTRALRFANENALPRYAVQIAAKLCSIYADRHEPDCGIRLGEAALSIALNTCTPEEVSYVSAEVARAHLARRDARAARVALKRANSSDLSDTTMPGLVDLITAESYLLEGRFDAALAFSRRARYAFETCRATRYLGSAICVQAEAANGSGRLPLARQLAGQALEILKPTGTTAALARAYRTSARVCRIRAHFEAAQALAERWKE